MELLAAVLLGALLAGIPLALSVRFVTAEAASARKVSGAHATVQQTYITELQNRLGAHTWGEFAQLQNDVDSPTSQASRVVNSFGEARSEEAFGEREQDIVDQYLVDQGIDLEGPTIG